MRIDFGEYRRLSQVFAALTDFFMSSDFERGQFADL